MRETKVAVVFGAGAAILSLAVMLNGFEPLLLVWLTIFALPLVINLLLGPTCACRVYTAVNTHKMPGLNRLSKANVFLQTVKPLIAEVQGEVSDEEIVQRAPLIPPVRRPEPGAPMPRKIRHYNGQVHAILFVMIWIRWTFPRLRFDQLMTFCWAVLIPLSILNLLVTAFLLQVLCTWPH